MGNMWKLKLDNGGSGEGWRLKATAAEIHHPTSAGTQAPSPLFCSLRINAMSLLLSTAPSCEKRDQHQGHQKRSSRPLSQMLEPGEHLG